MSMKIPRALDEEHEELHRELVEAIRAGGKVGAAANHVAEVLHPHFEKENELALPLIGIARDLSEGKRLSDPTKVLDLAKQFHAEYPAMLQEHLTIVRALSELEKAAIAENKVNVVTFCRKLSLHAEIEEALTYPAVLLIERALSQ